MGNEDNGVTRSALEGASAAAAGRSRELRLVEEVRHHLISGIETLQKRDGRPSSELAIEYAGGLFDRTFERLCDLEKTVRSRLKIERAVESPTNEEGCGCYTCWRERNPSAFRRMILCPTCGNKRCPRATNHAFSCTGSNEPGQPGSNY